MEISLEPGKYVVAVSGGVDSVVLLHVLRSTRTPYPASHTLVIAHFDHGIREESAVDRQFVESLAEAYGLPFYYKEGSLGPDTSEAAARTARYHFLHEIREKVGATAILTAHHQDDRIETAFINILRGTGRKGLSSVSSGSRLVRPLLDIPKQEIKTYAQKHNLAWREDSSNLDNTYLRNYLRNKVLPRLTDERRKQLVSMLDTAGHCNQEIDEILENILLSQENDQSISRSWFIALPHAVAREVLSHWLRSTGVAFDRTTIERLVVSLKTLPTGAQADIADGRYFMIGKDEVSLEGQAAFADRVMKEVK